MSDTIEVHFRAILDSQHALDLYHDSTGRAPKAPTEPNNTQVEFFATKDGRAALLVCQRGFALEPGETRDDVNGLSAVVAENVDEPTGRAALRQLLAKMIPEYAEDNQ